MPTHENTGRTAAVEALPDPPRIAWRKEMRERVLDAAHQLTCVAGGWDQTSLSAAAALAQVSRPSVYKEFGTHTRPPEVAAGRLSRTVFRVLGET